MIYNKLEFPWYKNGKFDECIQCRINGRTICPGEVGDENCFLRLDNSSYLNHEVVGAFYSYLCYYDRPLFERIHEIFERIISKYCKRGYEPVRLWNLIYHIKIYLDTVSEQNNILFKYDSSHKSYLFIKY